MLTVIVIQAILASPFLSEDPRNYLKGAFDLGRVFLYKWTVNWRFVDEETFLSSTFALSLLVGHISVLVVFGLFKWCELDGGVWKVLDRGLRRPRLPAGLAPTTPDCEFLLINIIGWFLFCDCRHRNRLVHLQLDWHPVCEVIALPVLLLVFDANTFLGLEDAISDYIQVRTRSAQSLYPIF